MRATLYAFAGMTLAALSGCTAMSGYANNQAGQSYYENGNYSMAAGEFRNAMATNPGNADYIANYAAALKKQGNAAGAERAWRHAVHLNPTHQPSYHGLSQMLVEQNRHQDANGLLQTWRASQPYSPEANIELAWLQREMGDSPGAARSLQQALAVNPNHAKAQSALGQYYQDIGRPRQAMAMYQQSLRADWHQPEVQSRLASLKGLAPAPMNTRFARGRAGGLPATIASSPVNRPTAQIAQVPMHQAQAMMQGQFQAPTVSQQTIAGTTPTVSQSYQMNYPQTQTNYPQIATSSEMLPPLQPQPIANSVGVPQADPYIQQYGSQQFFPPTNVTPDPYPSQVANGFDPAASQYPIGSIGSGGVPVPNYQIGDGSPQPVPDHNLPQAGVSFGGQLPPTPSADLGNSLPVIPNADPAHAQISSAPEEVSSF